MIPFVTLAPVVSRCSLLPDPSNLLSDPFPGAHEKLAIACWVVSWIWKSLLSLVMTKTS